MIITVTDARDPRLDAFRWRERQLASAAQRREKGGAGLFVAEGDLVVERALNAHCSPVALLCSTEMGQHFSARVAHDVSIYVADDNVRKDVTGLGVPLGATGLFTRPALIDPTELLARSSRVVVMEAVDNPTNLGAIVRSAVALGWDALLLDSTSADPLARRALRVSMGQALQLPFARFESNASLIAILHAHGFDTFALTPSSDAVSLHHVEQNAHRKIALLLGSERTGLTQEVLEQCTHKVVIPMHHNVDSLNVGAAAAIALYELGAHGNK